MTPPTPSTPKISATTGSAAARLLKSIGAAPAGRAGTIATVVAAPQHFEAGGPEQTPLRSNDVEMGPRHFRRADTWR